MAATPIKFFNILIGKVSKYLIYLFAHPFVIVQYENLSVNFPKNYILRPNNGNHISDHVPLCHFVH